MFFKFTTAGESHGKALVAIIEGVPAGLEINIDRIDHELWRRQQGYGRGGRMKIETDRVEFLSGVRHGRSIGSPISLIIKNDDFVHWEDVMSAAKLDDEPKNPRTLTRPRPGHADLAGGQKFAARDLRNILERASARETAARVACGAIARQFLAEFGVDIKSHVIKLGSVPALPLEKTWEQIAAISAGSKLNVADAEAESLMIELIDQAKKNGDTLGGIFEVVAKNVIAGLGSHTSWNEKLDGRIGQAFMSIQAVKAVEIGTAVANAAKFGSDVHDEIYAAEESAESGVASLEQETDDSSSESGVASLEQETDSDAANPGSVSDFRLQTPDSRLKTQDSKRSSFSRKTNRAGGLEGGITNGEEIRVRGYLKPISTLRKPLRSVDIDTKKEDLAAFERSDITAVPAAGVIGEAMLAIVIAGAMREKFGGDSVEEMRRNFDSYGDQLARY